MSSRSKYGAVGLQVLISAGLLACGKEPVPTTETESLSPRPRPDLVETLREDVERPRHPSDGGGHAWIDSEGSSPQPLTAGDRAQFRIIYEAGPEGVSEGGLVFLQASSFWGWSPPHDVDPAMEGYTEVRTEAEGIDLETETFGAHLFAARIVGRPLREGERLIFIYGAGPTQTRVDRYAESRSRLWLAVDGDGDGVRGLVADSPTVEIHAAEPTKFVLHAPSVVRPGEDTSLTLAAVDGLGNAGRSHRATIRLSSSPPGLALPETVTLEPEDRGSLRLDFQTPETGIFRILAEAESGLVGLSNPVFVTPKLPSILWADLHGHSSLSDGTGTPSDYFRYARDVAGLDVVALTDHDHWGMQPLALHPDLWASIQQRTREFHEPGRFVTLLGYEWTNWLHGHRHVLYFEDRGDLLSSLDREYEHPTQLWAALRGKPALTFAHHSAGEPVPTNWEIPPDRELEPITEIVSVHGSSEAPDSPSLIRGAVAGNFVRDALDRGYRLGFIGSGDSHDGHPGLAGIASPSAGLAALITDDHSRAGVLEALRARRAYATNGPRILLHVTLDEQPMGASVESSAATIPLVVMVLAEQPISRIDLIRDGSIVESVDFTDDGLLQRLERDIPMLAPDSYIYVRVVQIDGGAAWSSPFFAAAGNP